VQSLARVSSRQASLSHVDELLRPYLSLDRIVTRSIERSDHEISSRASFAIWWGEALAQLGWRHCIGSEKVADQEHELPRET